ncbi:MAG: FecR domain-containing protein, partial [Polyangiaceae bacterium]
SKRILFMAAAALVIGVFFSMNAWRHRAAPLAFQVDGQPAQQGAWLSAPADRALDLRFSDASDISLSPSGRARVTNVDANGARIVLEAGSAHVRITHRDASKWHVVAGPFDVLVTGTEFDVGWDPSGEQFRVHMQRGTVHVTGALLGEGHALRTGQTLEVSMPDGVVREPEDTSTQDSQPPRSETAQREETHEVPQKKPVSLSAAAVGSTAPDPSSTALDLPQPPQRTSPHEDSHVAGPSPMWARLAANGEYARAVQNADDTGFGDACANGKRRDVLALGDAARFTGHDDEARTAYNAVRSRALGDDLAAEAAFDLGKLAMDRAHDYFTAAKWFATYGNENPSGPLAREAAGRLIEARQR